MNEVGGEGKIEHERLHRSQEQRDWLLIGGTLFVVFAIATGFDKRSSTTEQVLWSAIWIALLLFIWLRLARMGVYANAKGVRIRNPFRSHEIAWSAIERFDMKPIAAFANGRVVLRDRRTITLWGIAAPNRATRPSNHGAQDLVAQLNAELESRSTRASA